MNTQRLLISSLVAATLLAGIGGAKPAAAQYQDPYQGQGQYQNQGPYQNQGQYQNQGRYQGQYRGQGQRDNGSRRWRRGQFYRNVTIPVGTPMSVTVNSRISTETSNVGDRWTGVMSSPLIVRNQVIVPAGTPVEGVVTEVVRPAHEQNATIGLAVRSVGSADGRYMSMSASTEPIVAGSARARNLGIIAGGAAAGAVLGHAFGHSTKGTIIGGLLGGLAGGAWTHSHGGYNIDMKPNTTVDFTVDDPVSVRS